MCVFLHTFDGDRFLPQLVKASFVDALAEVGIKPSAVLLENGYHPVVCKSKLRVHCMGAGIMCGDVDTQGVHCMGAGIMCGGCGHTRCSALFGSRDYVWGMWTHKVCTVWEQGLCVGDVDTQGVHCLGAGIMCGGCGHKVFYARPIRSASTFK